MKKISWFMGILFAMSAANAGTNIGTRSGSVANLSSAPAVRNNQTINYKKYQTRTTTRTYEAKDTGDLYYTKPVNRSALYKQYDAAESSSAKAVKTTKRTTRSEKIVNRMKRKYYLAHPFFQPLEGKFGSITDFSYSTAGYDILINQTREVAGLYPLTGLKASWDMSRFTIKEDFSYGITDKIAVLGMLQFDSTEYKFDWKDNSPDEKMTDDGLNLFGLGAQWRFVDNDEWIAMASAYFHHQKDVSDNYLLELKAGYKVSKSTIYALARGWYVDLEGNTYGNYIDGTDANGVYAMMYIPYQVNETSAMYIEGGLGVFSVLNEDWTLNVEALLGDYDWHNQASIKGAIGWQPNDWFALNLYAKTSFWDSADGKTLDLYWKEPNVGLNALTNIGTVDLDKYSETTIGLQAIFQF
ncbi:MAG: hypothetical protein IKW67_02245 [Alphaproteobacteria bacterium]|nr:hypothetical protein [Alphaproteobacteria bacterium]